MMETIPLEAVRSPDRAFPVSHWAALGLILLLGWGLRTHALDARSLWADEGWTMVLSQGPGLDDVVRTLADDQHPPLYFVLFRAWRMLTGDSEFATRYGSVLISMVAVAAIVPLGRGLFSARVGVLAALLLALADLHIDLAQEVRHYSLLTTLAVVSSLFYVRSRRRPTNANRVGYTLLSVALLYTHYLGGLVLIVQLGHMLLTLRPARSLASGLALFGVVCLGFLPWLPVVIEQNSVRWDNPLYFQNSLPNSAATFAVVRTALLGQHYVLLAGLALWGLIATSYHATPGEDSLRLRVRVRPLWPVLFLVTWIALVVGVTVAVNARREFLTVRNFVIVLPPLVLLVGRGLANLERAARWILIAMVVVIALTTVDARRLYPNWRAVTRHVTVSHLPGEPVLMDVWVGDFAVRYYVERQLGQDAAAISLREWRDRYGRDFLPRLLDYIRRQPAFWLVYWGDDPMDEYGALIADAGFERTATRVVDHVGTPLYSYRYDRLEEGVVAQFGDVFLLRRVEAPDSIVPGEPLGVSLWWSALQTPPLDYSISVFLLDDAGTLVAQRDGPPVAGSPPTSAWLPGVPYYDRQVLQVPSDLPPGAYELRIKLYWYGDQQPLAVAADDQVPDSMLILGSYRVGS